MTTASKYGPKASRTSEMSSRTSTFAFTRYLLDEAGGRLGFATFLQILGGLSEGLSIFLIIPIIRNISDPQSASLGGTIPIIGPMLETVTGSLEISLIVFTGLIIARVRFLRISQIYVAKLIFTLINNLRNRLFTSVVSAHWMRIASFRASDLNYTLTADIDRVQVAIVQTMLLTQSLVMLGVYSVASALVSPIMTAFAVGMGTLLLVIVLPLRRRAERLGQELTAQKRDQLSIVSDFLGGVKLAKTMNVEQSHSVRLGLTLEKLSELAMSFFRTQNTAMFWFQSSGAIALSIFAYLSLTIFDVSIERLIVLILLFSRISPLFSEIQSALQHIAVNVHAFTNMIAIKALCDAERERPAVGPPLMLRDELVMSKLSVAYPGKADPALKDVDIRIPAGRVTAIIGPSGGGKSTLADVLIGLLDPTSGAMTTDGVVIDASNRRAWRDQIAYVSQEIFMLNDTIFENLRFGRPEADEGAVWRALEMAQAKSFVERLPEGIQTEIGEQGFRLSGGERQRIALARALMGAPQLLVLDEATSALDWQSQALVAEIVSSLRDQMTIVTIAHRPSMISFADYVVVLRHGKVAESGRFQDLKGSPKSDLAAMLSAENTPLFGDAAVDYPEELRDGP